MLSGDSWGGGMVRGPKNKLGNRIAATILVVALLPILLSTIGTLSTIHDITDAAVLEGQRQVTLAVESVQKNSLENQTKLVNAELSKIENSVSYLATVSQQVLRHPELFKPLKDATALKKEADGYEWTPISSNKNLTTVFIGKGARLGSGSLADIGRTKYLEPLFVNALAQDSHAVAAYIIIAVLDGYMQSALPFWRSRICLMQKETAYFTLLPAPRKTLLPIKTRLPKRVNGGDRRCTVKS